MSSELEHGAFVDGRRARQWSSRWKSIDELRNLKDSLRIGDERDDVVDMAVVFYEAAMDRNFTEGCRAELVQSSCLYLTCSYELGFVYLQLCEMLYLVQNMNYEELVDPSIFILHSSIHKQISLQIVPLISSAVEDDTNDLDTRLPPRLFATDRYPDARLNIYSRPDILTVICDVLKGSKEMETILDSCFGFLFSLRVSECPISDKLVHALLCRQLVTKQKYEMWTVFGGQPLRLSLVEFGSVTGLPCGEFPEEYEPDFFPRRENGTNDYWDVLIGEDKNATLADISSKFQALKGIENPLKLPLALLLIVDGVLIANNQTHRPTFKSNFLSLFLQMTVIPMLSVNTNEDGWGEWDDEVRDKKVLYLIEQISKCHNFTKKESPGGYADLPLIYVNEKEPVVQHKKYIVIRKKKLLPTSSSKGTPSKTKVSTSTRGWKHKLELVDDDEEEDNDDKAADKANEGEDIKLWVKSQFSSIRHEFTESVKKFRSENLNLLKKIRLQQSYRGDKHHNSPFTTINVIGRGVNVSMHAGDETVSENFDNIVDDQLWKKISMETCKDSVCSPQKHLDETPSVILPKFISANSTELPPSDQPIYDTESKSRDEHLPSPRPPAIFDTATKPSPNDVTKEIKSSDLSLAENVDTLLDTVCKNISSSVAASDEDDKKEDDQKDNDHKEDDEIENDDEEDIPANSGAYVEVSDSSPVREQLSTAFT
ncbi:hypothetical protein ISN44_As01g036170 [Arabidopsis suecica]|uniref:DUF1985 domain-containing protein n=1 Tax=Arabidopsis suecica TaxID=45249 RepID=A0A8T2HB05_ARASU|nr:hypothetical protein ISN44_As01g036170 [Arabidopsis suecica]